MNTIIIPAYNPNSGLVRLVRELVETVNLPIIVINDGSEEKHKYVFKKIRDYGITVIDHDENKGKGAALKTGIQFAFQNYTVCTGFITCDADGQHLPKDILKISQYLDKNPQTLVLGSRDFSNDFVPKKSRLGNRFSAFYFKKSTGVEITDTQTGLRGIPIFHTEEALSISENRYDYEMTFLMNIAKNGTKIKEIPIETVYIDNNSSSHFRPFVDSIRIYKRPLKFAATALSSALIDLGIFTLLTLFLNNTVAVVVFIATVSARIISGVYNFTLNRVWSFRDASPVKEQFLRYLILYLGQLGMSILFVTLLSKTLTNLTLVKAFVDIILFLISYQIQKKWVFKRHDTLNKAQKEKRLT